MGDVTVFAETRAKRLRDLVYLRRAELAAAVMAGILIGRAYGFATAPAPEPQWWTIQAEPGGEIKGPIKLLNAKDEPFLVVPAGAALVRKGQGLAIVGEGGVEIRQYLIRDQPEAQCSVERPCDVNREGGCCP